MSENHAIYLDANAGAPLCKEAFQVLRSFFESLEGQDSLLPNPSSIHLHGRKAKRLVSEARERIASTLGSSTFVKPEQIIFTSSGTEANQLAIRSALESCFNHSEKPHWITSPVEHDSVLQMVQWVRKNGGDVDFLPVDEAGRPQVTALETLWKPTTTLVSMVWVNNETGVMSEIESFSKKIKEKTVSQIKKCFFHVDAAQAWGKIPVNVHSLGADWVSFSGHKIGALNGTGLLWQKPGVQTYPFILGKQELSRRGGTENLLGILSLGAAASVISPENFENKFAPLRNRFEHAVCEMIPDVLINGKGAPRVANTSNLSFTSVKGESLVMALDLEGISVSAGSACSSGSLEPSHVLLALGRSKTEALSSIRISLGGEILWEDLEKCLSTLAKTIERLRKLEMETL